MFDRLGTAVSRHWLPVLVGWAMLVAGVFHFAPRWEDVTHDGDFAYLPEAMTSVQGERLLDAAFPDMLSKSQVVIVVARREGPLQPGDVEIADRLAERLAPPADADGPIVGVLSHRTEVIGQKLISPPEGDGQAVLIILQLRNEFMAVDNMEPMAEIYGLLDQVRGESGFPAGLELGVTGSAAIGYDMLAAAEQSIRNTEWTTIALVVAILLLVYRAPGLVIVPLLTIAASVVVALGIVALATQGSGQLGWFDFKVFKTTKIFVVVILFGAGVDYCLFLISRYREELARGLGPDEAVGLSLARVGDALAASALTTIVGLGTMAFADFGKFRNSGPAIAVCLVVALVASMTLAPALLRAGGRTVFWPFGCARPNGPAGRNGAGDEDFAAGSPVLRGFWDGLSRRIVARPGAILVASFLLLAPLALAGLDFEITYDLLSELQADRPSVQGTALLRRYFPAGEIGPVIMLAEDRHRGFDSEEDRWKRIQTLADELYALEYRDSNDRWSKPITGVRSLIEPLGEPPEKFGLTGALRRGILRGNRRTKNTYLAQSPEYENKVTRFDLVFRYDPFSLESIRLLDHLQRHLARISNDPRSRWHETTFHFAGTTAGIRDLRAVTASDQALIQKLVPIAVLFVLIVVLRRPLVCVYLVLSVLFGYFVTIGATELVFEGLYGEAFPGLDWKVPIFLFVILIAVGQDYNVYLATRVFEEQKRRGPVEGLRVALVRTGGIITSCGVIMAGTFASMTTGTLRTMHELGFALSLGVLLDTFVIRTIMVPSFLMLWDRYFPVAVESCPAPDRPRRVNGPTSPAETIHPRAPSKDHRVGTKGQ